MAGQSRRARIRDAEPETHLIAEVDGEERVCILGEQSEYWTQRAREEKQRRRGLTIRQHELLALGYAAEWHARVDEDEVQDPDLQDLAQHGEGIQGGEALQEEIQMVPVPPAVPADRPRRPAPRARARRALEEEVNDEVPPQVPVRQHFRPAPKARPRDVPRVGRPPDVDRDVQPIPHDTLDLQQVEHEEVEHGAASVAALPATAPVHGNRPRRPAPKARQTDLMRDGHPPYVDRDAHDVLADTLDLERVEHEEVDNGVASGSGAAMPATVLVHGNRPRRPAPKARQRNMTCDGHP